MVAMSKSKPSVKSIRDHLATVAADQALVRIRRDIPDADRMEGFVQAVGTEWMLLALFDTNWFAFDGFVTLRVADISKIKEVGDTDSTAVRAAKLTEQWPPPTVKGLDLDTTAGLLKTASDHFPLATVYIEETWPDVCYVGRVAELSPTKLSLQSLDPEATWEPEADEWDLTDITRLNLGDRYSTVLFALSEATNGQAG